jgi:hypothetical protein
MIDILDFRLSFHNSVRATSSFLQSRRYGRQVLMRGLKNTFLGLDIRETVYHAFLAKVSLLFAPESLQLLWAVSSTVCAEACCSQALKLCLELVLSL